MFKLTIPNGNVRKMTLTDADGKDMLQTLHIQKITIECEPRQVPRIHLECIADGCDIEIDTPDMRITKSA